MEISIIIPIYNGEHTIERCLNSIVNQTFKDFEVLMIDDGSIDNSKIICLQFKKKDDRFKYFYKANGGAGSARNIGLKNCIGKYIVFPDCDDWIDNQYLEMLHNQMIMYDLDICICNSKHYYGDGTTEEFTKKYNGQDLYFNNRDNFKSYYLRLLKLGFVQGPSDKIYRMDIIRDNNLIFPNLRRSQDVLFNLDYLNYVNTIKVINNPLYNYCMGNMSAKISGDYLDIVLILSSKWNEIRLSNDTNIDEWDDYLVNYISGSINLTIRFLLDKNYNNKDIIKTIQSKSYSGLKSIVSDLHPFRKKNIISKLAIKNDNNLIMLLKILILKIKIRYYTN